MSPAPQTFGSVSGVPVAAQTKFFTAQNSSNVALTIGVSFIPIRKFGGAVVSPAPQAFGCISGLPVAAQTKIFTAQNSSNVALTIGISFILIRNFGGAGDMDLILLCCLN